MDLHRIAVGIDFSDESVRAAREAAALAGKVGAGLHLIHVGQVLQPPLPYRQWVDEQALEEFRHLMATRAKEDEVRLKELQDELQRTGVPVTHELLHGHAEDMLAGAAAQHKADLLVVGTHGRRGFSRYYFGSVAEGTTRQSEVPVLVARPPHEPGAHYQRVLVPTDFSPAAEQAFELALTLVDGRGRIDLFHVLDIGALPSATYVEKLERQVEQAAAARIEKAGPRSRDIQFSMTHSVPRAAILQKAAGYDLIVMGSHGRRGFARLLLGSVAENTIRHAPCSVLVTHALQADGE